MKGEYSYKTNKQKEVAFASKLWDTCPACRCTEFKLIRKCEGIEIECTGCGYGISIPYNSVDLQ